MRGIATYGVYVPYWRLDRKALAAALGAPSGSGTRSVASYDEDTTSLGVEAARAALRRAPRLAPEVLYFATASPAYLDKTNATAIHAALDLAPSAPAFDMAGAVRSGAGALRATLDARGTALAVLSDIRTGLPGSADEREGGDGAVAFLCGDDSRDSPVLAEPVASGSATAEFLERWRLPGEPASRQWEERFGEHVYVPLGESAVTAWRPTGAVAARRPVATGAPPLQGGGTMSYTNFLTWRGFLRREPPRRPDPQPPEAPPAARAEAWKFAFTGSRCQACGARHLPPQRVCVKCHAVDRMAPERLADGPATIPTFTVDRLAVCRPPPPRPAGTRFVGGGRFQCELTDVDSGAVRIGDRVEMTFRRLLTAGSVHNYFWKARPMR